MAMASSACLLLAALAVGARAHRTFDCHHGVSERADQDLRAPQPYPPRHPMIRRSLATAGSFSAVRIKYRVTSIDALDSTKQSFLLNTLIPAAISWLEQALSVVPVSGTLLFSRSCSSEWTTNPPVCASLVTSTCGTASDTTSAAITDDLLQELRVCSTCSDNGCTTGNCTTYAAGAGEQADFVLIV